MPKDPSFEWAMNSEELGSAQMRGKNPLEGAKTKLYILLAVFVEGESGRAPTTLS